MTKIMTVEPDYTHVAQTIEYWLQDYLKQSGCRGFALGMSGGVDSSVTAVLCRRVTPSTLGLLLPCGHTPSTALEDAQLVAEQFDIETITYDLTPTFESMLDVLGLPNDAKITIPLANIKARLRMVAWYYEANQSSYLVVGAGNRTEIALGFFTKYGDAGVDILPLGGLLKHEVRGLARYLRIPNHIITKVPTPGLWPGQTDEDELGASYDQLDDIVSGISPKGLSADQIKQLKHRMKLNEHKRSVPPICSIT